MRKVAWNGGLIRERFAPRILEAKPETLLDATGGNLVSVVEELMADGCQDFELQAPALLVSDHGGIGMLMDLQQAVRSPGGRLQLDPSVLVHDLPDDLDPPVRSRGRASAVPAVPPR